MKNVALLCLSTTLMLPVFANAQDSEWRNVESPSHLAGYATTQYVDPEGENGAFTASFNPIFHFLFNRVFFEGELEIELEEEGETEVELEYASIDYFVNDYFAVVAGKFLSPLGQFRQNIHPTWMNKLPSAPPGFGHDGAAPLADVGMQLRGGAAIGPSSTVNYAVFVGNGPELEAEDGEVEGILTDGFARDVDGRKVIGGRFGILPVPQLEIGISLATGEVAVTEEEGMEVNGDPARGYDVMGIDLVWHIGKFSVRGEYIQQEVDDDPMSVAPLGGTWEAWYGQGSYRFGGGHWEGVIRYTDFSSPHASQEQEQLALGINYLLAPQAMVKLGYESNDGVEGEPTDQDRWLLQFAYGF